MRQSLAFFWRRHLAVAVGAALACAVLTGALIVGDSVRGSLRALALQRLGGVEAAVVTEGFFRAALANEIGSQLSVAPDAELAQLRAVPLLLLPASAVHVSSGSRAANVTLHGVDERFLGLYRTDSGETPSALDEAWSFDPPEGIGRLFPPVRLNESLQRELGAEVGDPLLLSFRRATTVPRSSLLGRRDAREVVQTIRLTFIGTVPDAGAGSFHLAPDQSVPRNAFVHLPDLQRSLRRPQRVNALLVGAATRAGVAEALDAERLRPVTTALRANLRLEDLGLRLEVSPPAAEAPEAPTTGTVLLSSERYILRDVTVDTARAIADDLGAAHRAYLTYLANRVETVDGGSSEGSIVPYSMVTALGPVQGAAEGGDAGRAALGTLVDAAGVEVPVPGDGEILLSTWTQEDLSATAGDAVDLSYFVVDEAEQLQEQSARLRLGGFVAQRSLGADRSLTPDYQGITDSPTIAGWDPPFPVDLSLIRPRDEDYWRDYRGTPKAFVSLATGKQLWTSRFGGHTGVVLAPSQGDAAQLAVDLEARLRAALPLGAFGLQPQAVRVQALDAARGANDFAGLFVGFSWFLIVAAVLLVVMLFGLGVEQRAKEVGLLRAVGFSEASVRRRFLGEASVLAAAGAAFGVLGAIGYGGLMMAGLRTWWRAAVGSSQLYLHIEPWTLVLGFVLSLLVTLGAVFLYLRRLRRVSAPALLGGSVSPPATAEEQPSRRLRWTAWLAGLGALALFTFALLGDAEASAPLFFGVGTLVLIAGLCAFALWCRGAGGGFGVLASDGRGRHGIAHLGIAHLSMALRNSARNPGRSILSVVLVASACFVIVTVAAMRRQPGDELLRKDSGAGGLTLVAQSEVPLFHSLAEAEGRFELGVAEEAGEILDDTEIYAVRRLPGEDASCLNLYQPTRPHVLGVPPAFVERGGFSFAAVDDSVELPEAGNPWSLLDAEVPPAPSTDVPVIPAIADAETAQWILKLPLGEDLVYEDDFGRRVHVRLVALLRSSIFQSEVLVSEAALLRHFPSVEGHSFFLLRPPLERQDEVQRTLEAELGPFGFDVTTTADRLAAYKAVQNTYLSTFQTLGGLGLLLGTLGLGVVLVRNVVERRSELALLRAFGFRRRLLRRLVLIENVFLLLLGVALGTIAAMIASAPYLLSGATQIPWTSLGLTLGAVVTVGTLACLVASSRALRSELLPALRGL